MILYDVIEKIIKTAMVALLSGLFKFFPKPQGITTFRRLSAIEKNRIFSLLHMSRNGYLDDYAIQSQMLMLGIRYSPQFMKNLFYYTHKNNIRSDNKDLSAFLSLRGIFICSDNGEVRLQKGAKFLNFVIFFASALMAIFSFIELRESFCNLYPYLMEKHYFLLALDTVLLLASILGVIISFANIHMTLFFSIPAFRFARGYQAAWKCRDLFEVGEQNLYCGNR